MKNRVIATIFASLFVLHAFAQQKIKTSEYIIVYSDLAIASMKEYKIPASIKMAQAILESGSGNSNLALKSNNHFGIKCKSDWTGETVSHDDDEKGECFRKYESVYDSYMDHSRFLAERERYSSLFNLDITDYKSWAEGLKAAGYATNPMYAQTLIRIIEANKLYELDEKALEVEKPKEVAVAVVEEPKEVEKPKEAEVFVDRSKEYAGVKAIPSDYVTVKGGAIPTYLNNNVAFVIARKGETLESISKLTRVSVKKLMSYNELNFKPTSIREGSIIYIKAKKTKASNGYTYHTVAKGETLHYVSQKYGVRIDKIASLNLYTRSYIIKPGQKMLLR